MNYTNINDPFEMLRAYVDSIEIIYKYFIENESRKNIVMRHVKNCVKELGVELKPELITNRKLYEDLIRRLLTCEESSTEPASLVDKFISELDFSIDK